MNQNTESRAESRGVRERPIPPIVLEARAKLDEFNRVYAEVEKKLDEYYRLTGQTPQSVKEYFQNQANFSVEEWDMMEQKRKALLEPILNYHIAGQSPKKDLERRQAFEKRAIKKKAGRARRVKQNWIPMD